MRHSVLAISMAVLGFSSVSQADPSLTLDGFKALVASKQIQSIDDLVPALPPALTRNAILVYNSHGLNSDRVSPTAPRMILFNEDATLILAFTGNPGSDAIQHGLDTVEVLSVNQTSRRFEMREFAFNGIQVPTEPEVNPQKCLGCHGSNPRPIFQDYDAWPGFYGSFAQGGGAVKGSMEYSFFKTFLAARSSLPRYRSLDLSTVTENTHGLTYPSPDSTHHLTPALLLGQRIERRMLDRLATRVIGAQASAPMYPLLAYLGTADASACGGTIRDRVKELYCALTGAPPRLQTAVVLFARIAQQFGDDLKAKKDAFDQFNLVDTGLDGRGVIDLPYQTIFRDSDPYYKDVDPVAFDDELVIMESVFRSLGLSTEDVSTFPSNPGLGIYHVRDGNLYTDERYFLGLSQSFATLDPIFAAYKPDCDALRANAKAYVTLLPLPSPVAPGVLYLGGL